MRNPLKKLIILFSVSVGLINCKTNNTTLNGDFARASSFPGLGRNGAVVFTIDNKAYVGTGYNRDINQWFNDFYVYDADRNKWSQVAPFPGAGRVNAVGFSIGGKGYVGTGNSGAVGADNQNFKDFYSYDPLSDRWTKIADLPGVTRRGAVAFSVGGKGYVGTGTSNDVASIATTLGDFFTYDPTSDAWSVAANYPGLKVEGAFSFVINNQAYVGGGSSNGQVSNLFFSYNPSSDTWTRKSRLDSNTNGVQRYYGAAFALNKLGYVTVGNFTAATFEYNPANDTWTQKVGFEGSPRSQCVSFAFDGLASGYGGFVALGSNGSSSPYYDVWSFNPNAATINTNN